MEEDDFDKYEIDEEFKRMFWRQSGEGTKTANGLSDDQELRLWLKSLLEDEDYERHKDVDFIVGGKGQERSVRAHRLILTTRSRTFADILDKELDQHQPIKIAGKNPRQPMLNNILFNFPITFIPPIHKSYNITTNVRIL